MRIFYQTQGSLVVTHIFFPLPPQPYLAKLAGAFHHLSMEVVSDPITFLEDISGVGHIFHTCTELVKPTLSALNWALGPSSSVSHSGEGPCIYFKASTI